MTVIDIYKTEDGVRVTSSGTDADIGEALAMVVSNLKPEQKAPFLIHTLFLAMHKNLNTPKPPEEEHEENTQDISFEMLLNAIKRRA